MANTRTFEVEVVKLSPSQTRNLQAHGTVVRLKVTEVLVAKGAKSKEITSLLGWRRP